SPPKSRASPMSVALRPPCRRVVHHPLSVLLVALALGACSSQPVSNPLGGTPGTRLAKAGDDDADDGRPRLDFSLSEGTSAVAAAPSAAAIAIEPLEAARVEALLESLGLLEAPGPTAAPAVA